MVDLSYYTFQES